MPVRSYVTVFRDEFQYHVDHKKCLAEPAPAPI